LLAYWTSYFRAFVNAGSPPKWDIPKSIDPRYINQTFFHCDSSVSKMEIQRITFTTSYSLELIYIAEDAGLSIIVLPNSKLTRLTRYYLQKKIEK
jgi:hypothetical protein